MAGGTTVRNYREATMRYFSNRWNFLRKVSNTAVSKVALNYNFTLQAFTSFIFLISALSYLVSVGSCAISQ